MKSSSDQAGITLADLAARVGAVVEGDSSIRIIGVAPIQSAGSGDISFVANPSYAKHIAATKASALVLDEATPCDRLPVLRHKSPYLTFGRIIDILHPLTPSVAPGIHEQAVVEPGCAINETAGIGPLCTIGSGSSIGKNSQLVSSVTVGRNVTIGEDCLIHPGVRILDGTRIGNRVIIQAGAVLGSDGFGFAESDTGLKKIQQIGWVEIDDDVEIGANTTIDRGAMAATRIGRGTKIDNLVQIAHNVQIGEHCIIVSQVGISGSTRIGNGVILAGQVGLVGHIEVGDGVMVGAKSGVRKSVPAGKKLFGYPARDIMEAKRIEAAQSRLPELLKRVRKLEQGDPD